MLRVVAIRFLSNWRNLVPLIAVLAFFFVSWSAPLISPANNASEPAYNRVAGFSRQPDPPSEEYPLGIFSGGYDVLHTLIWGTRTALQFGLTVSFSTAIIGMIIGVGSSLFGGIVGRLGMRFTDAFLAFPVLAAIMVMAEVFKPASIFLPLNPFQQLMQTLKVEPVMLALILFSWMPYSRMIYAAIEQQKETEYVLAARVTGLGSFRIFLRHILPNAISPLIVLLTKDIGGMVVLETAFVFIGVSHYTEWGAMIAASKDWIIGPTAGFAYWWTFVPATLALILFSISWQWLGQRLNDVINPRSFSYLD